MRIIKPHVFALRAASATVLTVLALRASPARAQLAVSDSPVEGNTTVIASTLSGIASQQLPAVITQDTIAAQSLNDARRCRPLSIATQLPQLADADDRERCSQRARLRRELSRLGRFRPERGGDGGADH